MICILLIHCIVYFQVNTSLVAKYMLMENVFQRKVFQMA